MGGTACLRALAKSAGRCSARRSVFRGRKTMYDTTLSPKKESPETDAEMDLQVTLAAKIEGGPEQMLAEVADAEHDELAPTTEDGQPLSFSMNPGKDSRGPAYERENATTYDWTRSTQVGHGRLWGETLAQQERRHGREAQQARATARARAAAEADINRPRSSRAHARARNTPYQASTPDEDPDHEQVRPDPEADDPRARMDAETLAQVNKAAQMLADRYGDDIPAGRPELSRRLARVVADGFGPIEALRILRDDLDSIRGVRQPLSDVSTYQYRATVEGEVVRLFDHPAARQYQAGFLEGDDGTRRKFIYWQKSKKSTGKPTLREGDRVRFEDIRVNRYRGQACLAIVGDTEVTRLERGEGDAPRHGTNRGEVTLPPWSADSDKHAWINHITIGEDPDTTDHDREAPDYRRFACLICGDAFDTRHGARTHHGLVHKD